MNDLNHNEMPEDVRPVAHALDRLAESERASASPGIEIRIAQASGAALSGRPALRLAGEPASRSIIARIGLLRIAAAIAIVGVGIGAISILRPTNPVGDDVVVDNLLDSAASLDGLASTDQIDSLVLDLDSLSDSLLTEPLLPDLDSRDSSL
ncbi:MAG: hypothetical protein ACREJO_10110 [Phycisphaerales bacterium]